MKVKANMATSWARAYKAALATEGKETDKTPTDAWKRQMLLAEHSPIRLVEYDVKVDDIKQWVTTHIVRHWLGFIPFVHSQRDDRRHLPCSRDKLPQGSLNDMAFSVNAQALINISRKRLCFTAHKETRGAWVQVLDAIQEVDPVMAEKMVPECVYRGFCPERKCCGFVHTDVYKTVLNRYRHVGEEAYKNEATDKSE